ncbi:MAG: universal stress protein [Ktedonobacteraceae bacterium]
MSKRVLLGIDTSLSPATKHALHKVSELIQQATSLHLVLLNVIPIPYAVSPSLGMYVGQVQPLSVTGDQRAEAEDALRRARTEVQKQGIAAERIEVLIRVGEPAHEIVKAARELGAEFIVIGTRGDSWRQKIRRFFVGSTSRRVLQLASCPVMLVVTPQMPAPSDLVAWYEKAIASYLREHTSALTIFTPREAASLFIPPHKKKAGRKEIAAATLALEHLVSSGALCRHEVKGELRYVND